MRRGVAAMSEHGRPGVVERVAMCAALVLAFLFAAGLVLLVVLTLAGPRACT